MSKEKNKKLKSAVELAAIEAAASAEKFPADLKESFALLAEIKAKPVSNDDEGDARDAQLVALGKHIHAIQQGLPVVESKSSDYNHQHMTSVVMQMKLERLTRTNPEIKELLAEKTATEKKLAAVLEIVATASDLTAAQEAIAKL